MACWIRESGGVMQTHEPESAVDTALVPLPVTGPEVRESVSRSRWRPRRSRIGLTLAIGWLALVVFGALFANFLPLRNPADLDIGLHPAFAPIDPFSSTPLGTDALGQDILS